jgi:leader peptidase (prepilin peptidase)/N-methyltransferase
MVPASRCPHCGHKIKPWENIPVVSYLFLRGKCSNCKAGISARYPAIELVTGLLSVAVIFYVGVNWSGLAALVFTWSLIALTMIDFDTYLLPDDITLPLLWLGLITNSFNTFTDLPSALWGAIAGYLALWSVYKLFKLVTGKEGMGYGDFKLLAVLGAWMGWQMLPQIILLSSLVGAVIGVSMIVIRGRDKNIPIPFGPYLAIAGWIAFIWGDTINQSYLKLFVAQ